MLKLSTSEKVSAFVHIFQINLISKTNSRKFFFRIANFFRIHLADYVGQYWNIVSSLMTEEDIFSSIIFFFHFIINFWRMRLVQSFRSKLFCSKLWRFLNHLKLNGKKAGDDINKKVWYLKPVVNVVWFRILKTL
jgi:hypothetical protein